LTFPVFNIPFLHPAPNILDVTHSSTYQTAYTDACKNVPYHAFIYKRLSEYEPLGSKHVEGTKKN